MTTRIGILACGVQPADLIPRYGTCASMTQAILPARAEYRAYEITQGEWPDSPSACDAFVLTGSPAGVYDDLPWIGDLMGFLHAARGRSKLVGICFGHQALAAAFGGNVAKSAKGWGLGVQRYAVRQPDWWTGALDAVQALAIHQDQIEVCPPGARVVLASDFTPYAALDYGDAISVQFHPEFSADFLAALIEANRDGFGDRADPALASLAQPNDSARVGAWFRHFLGEHG